MDFHAQNASHFPSLLQFFLDSFLLNCFWIDPNSWKWWCTFVNLFSWYVFIALPLILKCVRKALRVDEGWGYSTKLLDNLLLSDSENTLIQICTRIIQSRNDGETSWNIHFLRLKWCMYDAIYSCSTPLIRVSRFTLEMEQTVHRPLSRVWHVHATCTHLLWSL